MTNKLDNISLTERINDTIVNIEISDDGKETELNFRGYLEDVSIYYNIKTNNIEIPIYNDNDDVWRIPFDAFEVGIIKFIEIIKAAKNKNNEVVN